MARSGAGRTLPAKGRYPVQVFDRSSRSLRVDVRFRNREPTSSAGQRTWKKEGNERQGASPVKMIVVEQWICFVLGLVCMAFGIWGICMKPEQDAFSGYIAWLGLPYMPTLRVTAVVCIGLGVMLARRGWSHL
jgi:hypothetical protein